MLTDAIDAHKPTLNALSLRNLARMAYLDAVQNLKNPETAAYFAVAIWDPAKPKTSTPTAALSGLVGTCLAK